MSVYYTDIYKLRGVGPKSKLDKNNIKKTYQGLFIDEMKIFKPDIVLLMGNSAQSAFKKGCKGTPTIKVHGRVTRPSGSAVSTWKILFKGTTPTTFITVVCVPHPSRAASGTWKKIVSCPITAKAKKDYIVTQVESAIKI